MGWKKWNHELFGRKIYTKGIYFLTIKIYYAKNEQVTPWFGAIMHYELFKWWDVLIQGKIGQYQPNPKIVDLNNYQKPIFQTVNGVLKPTIQIWRE